MSFSIRLFFLYGGIKKISESNFNNLKVYLYKRYIILQKFLLIDLKISLNF